MFFSSLDFRCGMVALSMGLSGRWKVEQLLDMCVSQGWSRRGEMYSCEWMTKIALQAGAKARHLRGGLKNHLECITRCLAIGGSLLVPYPFLCLLSQEVWRPSRKI